MVKRRSMVIGLGALATGSGAVFSSAAFASSTAATSDFRVVVEDDLTVEAGPAFRSGNSPTDDYEAFGDTPPYITDTTGLYGGSNEAGLDGVVNDADDLPAMYVSDGTNGGLSIELGVPNRHSEEEVSLVTSGDSLSPGDEGDPFRGTFSEVLQVRNDGTEPLTFGIKFSDFGDIVTDSEAGDGVILTEDVYEDIFSFSLADGGQISSDDYDGTASDPADQTLANSGTEIGVGETITLDLTVDLRSHAGAIREAATPGTDDVFNNGSRGTVQLVKELQFGTTNSSEAF